jgi:hypothetical protein
LPEVQGALPIIARANPVVGAHDDDPVSNTAAVNISSDSTCRLFRLALQRISDFLKILSSRGRNLI